MTSRAFAPYGAGLGNPGAGDYSWLPPRIAAGEALWCVAADGTLVGTLVVDRTDPTTLGIETVCVDPDLQSAGWGKAVMLSAESLARESGCRRMKLYTAQRFTHLVGFYSGLGFRVQAVGPHPLGRDDLLRVFLTKSFI